MLIKVGGRMSYNKFEEKARRAISEMKSLGVAEATVVHHDDADGLCSAAITKKSVYYLLREGFEQLLDKSFLDRRF